MLYSILATLAVVLHLVFTLFVVAGALLVWKWPRVAWLHIPAALWGALVELLDQVCPLTPLENWLRTRAGEAGYAENFLEHYVLALVYPSSLTRELQLALGGLVIVINVVLYGLFVRTRSPSP